MSLIPRCITCDSKVDPWSADVQCARCSEPCRVCGKDVSLCTHPLADNLFGTETHGDPLLKRRVA